MVGWVGWLPTHFKVPLQLQLRLSWAVTIETHPLPYPYHGNTITASTYGHLTLFWAGLFLSYWCDSSCKAVFQHVSTCLILKTLSQCCPVFKFSLAEWWNYNYKQLEVKSVLAWLCLDTFYTFLVSCVQQGWCLLPWHLNMWKIEWFLHTTHNKALVRCLKYTHISLVWVQRDSASIIDKVKPLQYVLVHRYIN